MGAPCHHLIKLGVFIFMSKRFIDTDIFSDEWFSELSKDGKLFFIYFITNCDHAGVLRLNRKLCEFQIGIKSSETVIKELSKCLISVKDNTFFMPNYLKFQYPNFPKSNVKQQDSAIKILKELNLWNETLNTYITVTKELNNSYDNGNGNDNDSVNDNVVLNEKNKNEIPSLNDFVDFGFEIASELKLDYTQIEFQVKTKYETYIANGWKDGHGKPIKNWRLKLRSVFPYFKHTNPIINVTKLTNSEQRQQQSANLRNFAKAIDELEQQRKNNLDGN